MALPNWLVEAGYPCVMSAAIARRAGWEIIHNPADRIFSPDVICAGDTIGHSDLLNVCETCTFIESDTPVMAQRSISSLWEERFRSSTPPMVIWRHTGGPINEQLIKKLSYIRYNFELYAKDSGSEGYISADYYNHYYKPPPQERTRPKSPGNSNFSKPLPLP